MRSGWEQDAVYVSFDMGPWGSNHMNEDQLNLELFAYGRNLLVNSGRWRYTTSPGVDWLDKAAYFKSTAACNSVLCDGMSQVHGDAQGTMVSGPGYDYACGRFCAGYGTGGAPELSGQRGGSTSRVCLVPDACHTREVFFDARTGTVLVRDTLEDAVPHRYTQIWHTAGGRVEGKDGVYWTCFEDANLILVQYGAPDVEIVCGSEQPFKGWNCPAYDHLVPAPQIESSLSGKTVVFETLLLPVRGAVDAGALPGFSKTETDGKTLYRVEFEGKIVEVEAGRTWKPV